MFPSKTAAWLAARPTPQSPSSAFGPGEIVIHNDVLTHQPGWQDEPTGEWHYAGTHQIPVLPFVLGCDVASEVVEVGP